MIHFHVADLLFFVLIDTWWNVNLSYRCRTHLLQIVLIDTWWNVNRLFVLLPHVLYQF